MAQIDKKFPHFSLETYNPKRESVEKVTNDDFRGKWLALFFYPADFTFVCPTELLDMNRREEDFNKLKAEVVAVSTDTVFTHKVWIEMEELLKGFNYLMAADHNGKFSRELGIYDEDLGMAQRACFLVDPENILRAADIVSDPIGRSAGEIVRKLKALKFVRENPGKVCPASWDEGGITLAPDIKKAGKVYREFER